MKRRPPRIGLVTAEFGMRISMRKRTAQAAVAQRLLHIAETSEHPLVRGRIPKDGSGLAQLVEHRIRIGDERRIGNVKPGKELVEGHTQP